MKLTRMLSSLLVCALLLVSLNFAVVAADGTLALSGSGIESDPYIIGTIDEFKAFRDDVNGGNSYKGKFVKLTSDIDLENEEWTPIGNSTNKFQGKFDGGEYTVSNLKITGNNSYVGLFGYTTDGEIKNLTVNNAEVSGYLGVGVVAGCPYTSDYTNITVTGHVEVNGFAYVGGVLGRNLYADATDITLDVDATSYVYANSVDGDTAYRTYVGGVIGFMGEGNHTVSNVTSNIKVIGSTIDVGGVVGIAHYGNTFRNVTCSGNVTLESGDLDDVQEIGGIAGVWLNQAGQTVIFDNCIFSGAISVNGQTLASSNAPNGGLVGTTYGSGTGSLSLNGTEYEAVGVGMVYNKTEDVYEVTGADGLKTLASKVNGGESYEGDTVKLMTDAYFNEESLIIGDEANSFKGTFDGRKHWIKDLANYDESADGFGLFCTTGEARFENVLFGSGVAEKAPWPFVDVDSRFPGYKAIEYCYEHFLMNGVTANTFAPNAELSRAMLVTMIYRMAGSPLIASESENWYSSAREWAMDNGISDGSSMEAAVSREQLATMLYRYAVLTGADTSYKSDLSKFDDSENISEYAKEAMSWAIGCSIMSETDDGLLAPEAAATRAQTANAFYRALSVIRNN